MDFEYREDHSEQRDLRDATPEDERHVSRALLLLPLITVIVLLLIYLFGGSLGDSFQAPPA